MLFESKLKDTGTLSATIEAALAAEFARTFSGSSSLPSNSHA